MGESIREECEQLKKEQDAEEEVLRQETEELAADVEDLWSRKVQRLKEQHSRKIEYIRFRVAKHFEIEGVRRLLQVRIKEVSAEDAELVNLIDTFTEKRKGLKRELAKLEFAVSKQIGVKEIITSADLEQRVEQNAIREHELSQLIWQEQVQRQSAART